MANVFEFSPNDKQENPILCPHCATSLICRYGTYQRNHPEQSGQIAVQRYLCKSPMCPWRTFSILPYPILPIVRHFYQTIFRCYTLYNVQVRSQATTARQLGVSRGVIKRLGTFCHRFLPWFDHEKVFALWGPDPEANHEAFWPDFTRDFSQALYPRRWLIT